MIHNDRDLQWLLLKRRATNEANNVQRLWRQEAKVFIQTGLTNSFSSLENKLFLKQHAGEKKESAFIMIWDMKTRLLPL